MPPIELLRQLMDCLQAAPGVVEVEITGPDGALLHLRRAPLSLPAAAAIAATALAPLASGPANAALALPPELLPASAAPVLITSDRVGVFHASRPPLQQGDSVAAGQIVGYVESMKLMNELRSSVTGRVEEQYADDQLPVEYGQPLFAVSGRERQ